MPTVYLMSASTKDCGLWRISFIQEFNLIYWQYKPLEDTILFSRASSIETIPINETIYNNRYSNKSTIQVRILHSSASWAVDWTGVIKVEDVSILLQSFCLAYVEQVEQMTDGSPLVFVLFYKVKELVYSTNHVNFFSMNLITYSFRCCLKC